MPTTSTPPLQLAFIGGGNMASAIIGGLIQSGRRAADISVVEPLAEQRARLAQSFGVVAIAEADASLAGADLVVWAIKPQQFKAASSASAPHVGKALHLSIMAGVRSDDMARLLGTERIVRSMPNTPALIGRGIAGLYARPAVNADGRAAVEALLAPTGTTLWVDKEADLDAVTALSGSGPAYVFYFIEAMQQAASDMGLSPEQGRALALATFSGATELAAQSQEPPSVLRERVTSKGGTTYAALTTMESSGVKAAFIAAMRAAEGRAQSLGDELAKG
ncbi:MAG: pyrroline-5-carboxylate reductase [Rhizobacter sp.]|nr:pyrroline-5-carboxylate reductase [Rhizobacter sp.]